MEANEKIDELYERIWQLEKENMELEERNNKAIDNLEKSIKSIDEKIKQQDFRENYINDYRKAKLKGIRTKSKEILKILKGEDNKNSKVVSLEEFDEYVAGDNEELWEH